MMNTRILHWILSIRACKWPVWAALCAWLGAAVLAAVVLWQWQRKVELQHQAGRLQSQMITAQQAHTAPITVAEYPLQHFEAVLGDKTRLEDYLKTLFQIARRQNLNLPQGNYKPEHANGFDRYSIDLPLRGDYVKVRTICEQMLLALPFSALEEIQFKRESIGEAALETHLRFTLFLKTSTDIQAPSKGEGQ